MTQDSQATPLPWQQQDWQRLQALGDGARMPHALLLAGAPGLGKGHFADLIAAWLLCEHPEQAAAGRVACGHCHGCSMRMSGYHPDLLKIPAPDPGRLVRIDTIRAINDFLSETAQQGGYRVVRIDGVDSMTIGAANALLKSLEEPGERTVFILVSDMPSRIMPTILSRCQKFSFTPPSFSVCKAWLTQHFSTTEEAAFWWRAACGMPLAALEQGSAEARKLRQQLSETFDSLVRGGDPVAEAARLDRQQLGVILEYGIRWLEDMVRLGLSGETEYLQNTDMLPLYRQGVKNGRVRDWFRLLDYAREQRRLIAQGNNPNPQLVLEAWLIRWAALLRSWP